MYALRLVAIWDSASVINNGVTLGDLKEKGLYKKPDRNQYYERVIVTDEVLEALVNISC
jgi:hypothetical protein